ncbi:MAG: OsmC family protein [Gemmatimonadaceae bacterium]|nr:OsmC family protein [Gemmatimonadaceae bacterium]
MTAVPVHEKTFTVSLDLGEGFAQHATFDDSPDIAPVLIDEPAPLGQGSGASPTRLLAASVGSCLAASLAHCLRKSRVDLHGVRTKVEGTVARSERGRLRVTGFRVLLEPVVPADQHARLGRCVEVFEDFCTVTASVREAIHVEVTVVPTVPQA